jgi:hypothetical protein
MGKHFLFTAIPALFLSPLTAIGEDSWLTRSGYYRISYVSELKPIEINRIHNWVVHIETPTGDAVLGARIAVSGGMPLHNHGLPTDPKMTAEISHGDYLLEGVRFHMNGYWELLVTIEADGKRDTVIIPLTL